MDYGTGERTSIDRSGDDDEALDKAQMKVSEFKDKAQQQAELSREKAATATEHAASQLREKAMQQGGKPGEIGTKVADKLHTTSGYVQQHDTMEILDDIEKFVRDHPLQAVGAAVVAGFVLARIIP